MSLCNGLEKLLVSLCNGFEKWLVSLRNGFGKWLRRLTNHFSRPLRRLTNHFSRTFTLNFWTKSANLKVKGVDIEFFTLIIVFRRVISFIYQKFYLSDRVPLTWVEPTSGGKIYFVCMIIWISTVKNSKQYQYDQCTTNS